MGQFYAGRNRFQMTRPLGAALIFAGLLVLSAEQGYSRFRSRILPVKATLTYSHDAAGDVRTMDVRSASGRVAYHLSIQPDRDVAGRAVVLNIVLQPIGNSNELPNLLDSTGKLLGYQSYTLSASDFASGIGNSTFGPRRQFMLPKIGICVQFELMFAKVLPFAATAKTGRGYQFERLTLIANVGNLVSKKGLASCQIRQ